MIRILAIVLGVCSTSHVMSQSWENQKLSLGIGTAFNYYRSYETGVGAGFRFSYEGTVKDLEIAQIDLGGSIAYSSTDATANPSFNNRKYTYHWNSVLIAPRLSLSIPMDSKLNIYLGTHIGIRIVNFKEEYKLQGFDPVSTSKSYSRFHAGAFAGADYSLNKNFRIFGEAGYDFLWFTLGLKLNIPN